MSCGVWRELSAPAVHTWWEPPSGGVDGREAQHEVGRLDYECEDYFGHRWWPTRDVIDSGGLCFAGSLPRRPTASPAGACCRWER